MQLCFFVKPTCVTVGATKDDSDTGTSAVETKWEEVELNDEVWEGADPAVEEICEGRDAARRLLTFGVKRSATATEATARTCGFRGAGFKDLATAFGIVSARAVQAPSAGSMVAAAAASPHSFKARVIYSTNRSAAKRVWQLNR